MLLCNLTAVHVFDVTSHDLSKIITRNTSLVPADVKGLFPLAVLFELHAIVSC